VYIDFVKPINETNLASILLQQSIRYLIISKI